MKPHQINLNLLRVLDALLQTQSSSAASKILNISQPAVSKHLVTLREHFHDPLLIRTGGSNELTPKAQKLRQEVHGNLIRIYSLFAASDKEELSEEINFRIMTLTPVINLMLTDKLKVCLTIAGSGNF